MNVRERLGDVLRGNLVPSVLFGTLLVLALVFLDEIRAWFSLGPEPAGEVPAASAPAPAASAPPSVPSMELPERALAAIRGALDDYEAVRASLAADRQQGLPEKGRAIAAWIRRASEALEEPPEAVSSTLLDAGTAAEKLAAADNLKKARLAFGDLSRTLLLLANVDPRLREGWHVFECPMAEGFKRWLQPGAELENPYMGQKMLTCGSASDFAAPEAGPSALGLSHEGHGHEGDDVAFYTCSMHPSVKQDQPGICPICSMDLTPVTFDEEEGGVIFVDSVRRQRIGVRVGKVERRVMTKEIRTVGKLTYDETKLHDVTLKYKGWIQKLYANAVGKRVRRGEALFAVYSPELYAAQGDLISALSGPALLAGTGGAGAEQADAPDRDPLVAIARERLALLDAYGLEKHLMKTGKPVRYITVTAPISGYVVEKSVVDGSAVAAGERVMRIAGLDTVWIEAELYESELPLVTEGQRAEVGLTYLPGKRYEGTITYVYPYLDPRTRTGQARIELANPELELKPDMYANVVIDVDLGERLAVPRSAVVYTGRRRLVFVDLGEGRLRPQPVELGARAGDWFEVLSGLRAGDHVVTSGNFLVAAESRIRSAERYWGAPDPDEEASVPLDVEGREASDAPETAKP